VVSKLITVIVLGGFTTALAAMYLLPVLIGWARHVPDIGMIAVIDILLGWTFLGWVLALALALRSVNPGGQVVQVVQNVPPSPPSPGAGWAGPPGAGSSRPEAPPLVIPPRPVTDQEDADRG
jgi:hypothetical protein